MKKRATTIFSITYGVLLAGLAVYVLLDSFVIPHRYASAKEAYTEGDAGIEQAERDGSGEKASGQSSGSDADASERDAESGQKGWKKKRSLRGNKGENSEETLQEQDTGSVEYDTVNEYHENGIDITLKQYRVNDTNVYVADVKLDSADRLKTALAEDTYGRNIKEETSVTAANNNAVLAVNGDFYGSRETGYVIREGVLYRDKSGKGNEDLVVLKNGEFLIINEDDISAQELLDMGAWQVFSFGPALVTDGELAVEEEEEVGRAMQSNPRTAIGLIDDLHYVFVVADGRTTDNAGLTLRELAGFMKDLGAETAYNLDGGGSSTMIFRGELINNPTTGGRRTEERSVSDIVYIR